MDGQRGGGGFGESLAHKMSIWLIYRAHMSHRVRYESLETNIHLKGKGKGKGKLSYLGNVRTSGHRAQKTQQDGVGCGRKSAGLLRVDERRKLLRRRRHR